MEYVFAGVVGIFSLVIIVISFIRLRTGGPGPGVNWVPPRLRKNVNARYKEKGWDEPFDENGHKKKSRMRPF